MRHVWLTWRRRIEPVESEGSHQVGLADGTKDSLARIRRYD